MAVQENLLRTCPTRIDRKGALFTHKVAAKTCRERQRTLYHKCFSCAWNDNHVALHGEPSVKAPENPEGRAKAEESSGEVRDPLEV